MSYNGSGLFQINTSGQPVVAGTVITASAFNALTADLATGLTTAITKDGQTATTAQIPFAQGLRSTLVTDSTTSTSGSIITDGGLGVAKAVNIGTTLGVTGAVTGSSTITGTKLIPTGTSVTGNGMYLPAANTLGFSTNGTNAVTIDASQNLLVGTTTTGAGVGFATKIAVDAGAGYGPLFRGGASGASYECMDCWNIATTGNNVFMNFYTEATPAGKGSITYNRAGGLVTYNTTSDYRAKTVNGPVQNALSKIASLKPCTGRMNGAEVDIDFFVAHELQEVVPSAVTGEKDAVNEDNTPNYQMVDKSALIPLLTAALQEQQALITTLTERITALENA